MHARSKRRKSPAVGSRCEPARRAARHESCGVERVCESTSHLPKVEAVVRLALVRLEATNESVPTYPQWVASI